MLVPDRVLRVLSRRQETDKVSAIQRMVEQRAQRRRDESQVVPTEGDLICFKVSIRPC